MGKNMVSKRTKGKVDFKRKEDQVRRPVGGEEDKVEVCHEKNNESDIEISRDEAISSRQRFYRKNPDGLLSKEDFIEEATDQLLAQTVFKVFDKDSSCSLDFMEYMQARRALQLNTTEEKLEWIFSVFDSDSGGTIEMSEIEQIVSNIFHFADIKPDRRMIQACVMDIKRSVDRDNDGSITKEEFLENARSSKFIRNMFLTE